MRAEVIMRQRKAMTKAGLDALVAISPENFAYTTVLTRWLVEMSVNANRVVYIDSSISRDARLRSLVVNPWGAYISLCSLSFLRSQARLLLYGGIAQGEFTTNV